MSEKKGTDVLLEHVPDLKKPKKVLLLYFSMILLFIFIILIYWFFSNIFWYGSILIQAIVSSCLSLYYIILANKAEKIREKYHKKYQDLSGQKFWYNYQAYLFPIIAVAYYFPLFLYTYDFLPSIVDMPNHFMTNSYFPIYISIPLGFFVVLFGYLMKRHSQDNYGVDTDSYLYMIFPEKGYLIKDGMYKYLRNPQYISRGIMSFGFGIVANNLSAMIVGLIHLVSYIAIIPAEDKELIRRFGNDFKIYKKKVPAIFPKFGNWRDFLRKVFVNKD
jgi:protein-S-isoprenylcysteine O-methyltransferase Ste14